MWFLCNGERFSSCCLKNASWPKERVGCITSKSLKVASEGKNNGVKASTAQKPAIFFLKSKRTNEKGHSEGLRFTCEWICIVAARHKGSWYFFNYMA